MATAGPVNGGGDDEETVMTPLRSKDGTLIRIERVKREEMNSNRIHYLGDGPYSGIAVNRAIKGKPKKISPDNLRRFTAHVHNSEGNAKEIRELRFWYKPEAHDENEETTESFFRDLLNPVAFPKDYLSFVKRVLSLVKCYPAIQLLELEIRPFRDTDTPVDVRGRPLAHTTQATMIRRTMSVVAQPSAPPRRQQSAPAINNHQGPARDSVSTTPGEILLVPVPVQLGVVKKKEAKPVDENENILTPSNYPAPSNSAVPAANGNMNYRTDDSMNGSPVDEEVAVSDAKKKKVPTATLR